MRTESGRRRTAVVLATEPPWAPQEWTAVRLSLDDDHPIHAGHVTARPGSAPGFDMHFGLELGVVLSGRMRRYWRTWKSDLGPGQVWFCGIWERHGWEVLTPSCRHLVLVLLPKVVLRARFEEAPDIDWMAAFTVPPRHRPQAGEGQRSVVRSLAERFTDLIAPEAPERPVALELLTLELLLTLLSGWATRSDRHRSWLERHYEAVNQAVEMALRARGPISTAQAGRACGMSARAFTQAFEGLMGISFSKFALRSRLSAAAAQLRESDEPISVIAARWGFSRVEHFQRSFREHYGVSAMTHRRRGGPIAPSA